MATSWSTASGRESDKQGKDGASWCGNEVREGKKIKNPAERKEQQGIPTISLYPPLLPTSSITKETASQKVFMNCKNRGKKLHSKLLLKKKANNISAD